MCIAMSLAPAWEEIRVHREGYAQVAWACSACRSASSSADIPVHATRVDNLDTCHACARSHDCNASRDRQMVDDDGQHTIWHDGRIAFAVAD